MPGGRTIPLRYSSMHHTLTLGSLTDVVRMWSGSPAVIVFSLRVTCVYPAAVVYGDAGMATTCGTRCSPSSQQ
jgi:hypothetical protein